MKTVMIAIRKWLKKWWGIFPISIFVAALLVVLGLLIFKGWHLRSIPLMVMIWFGIVSVGLFGLWLQFRLKKVFSVRAYIWWLNIKMFLPLLMVSLTVSGAFFSLLYFTPEHKGTYRNEQVVVAEPSFLGLCVYYYDYENAVFRGKELASEYYSSYKRNQNLSSTAPSRPSYDYPYDYPYDYNNGYGYDYNYNYNYDYNYNNGYRYGYDYNTTYTYPYAN